MNPHSHLIALNDSPIYLIQHPSTDANNELKLSQDPKSHLIPTPFEAETISADNPPEHIRIHLYICAQELDNAQISRKVSSESELRRNGRVGID